MSRAEIRLSWRSTAIRFATVVGAAVVTSTPSRSTLPARGDSSRPIADSRVDLPAPLAPTRAVTCPDGKDTATSSRTLGAPER